MPRTACGIDLGQATDPTFIAVVEVHPRSTLSGVALPSDLHVVHLERLPLDTSYSLQVAHLRKLNEALFHVLDDGLVLDRGGVGRAVCDELRSRGVKIIAVQSTAGAAETCAHKGKDGEDWNVSRHLLLSNLASVIHGERLKVSPALPLAKHLMTELEDLESHISAAGRESIEVSAQAQGHHADAVQALALALWRVDKPLPRPMRWSNFRIGVN